MTLPATLQLGSLELASPFLLAPLESVSDCAFRALCHRLGASLTYAEMTRARGLGTANAATLALVDTHDADVPTGAQLLAHSADELKQALENIENLAATTHPHFKNLRAIDLNFGCPSPSVIRAGAGPALLKRRGKLEQLFTALADWRRATTLPIGAVGAKIRLGLNRQEQDQRVYLPIVELANAHLDYLTVHARHARQGSGDAPTWSAIGEIKDQASIPIIGNGALFTLDDVEQMHAKTRCDGFLIARGAIRSPWLFRVLCGRGAGQPTLDELGAARAEYESRAKQLNTRPKYLAWHAEGFERMANRIQGKPAATSLPSNENL